jgi:peptidyl-prolyl cis-trans isomerase C
MKRILVFAMTAVILSASAWIFPASIPAAENAAATVNGEIITTEALDKEMNEVKNSLAKSGRPVTMMDMGRLKKQVLDNMIATELLWQECQAQKRVASADAVNNHVARVRKNYPDDAAYQKELRSTGLSDKSLRTRVEKRLSIQGLIESEVTTKLKITDKEMRGFYDDNLQLFSRPERVRASHILIKVPAGADDKTKAEAKKRIDDIRKKAIGGEDFAELARKYSEGPSAKNGGALGEFSRERMVKPFADAAFAMKPGDISDVVETRFGYHIILVASKSEAGRAPYEEVKDQIRAKLTQDGVRDGIQKYIDGLRDKAEIEIATDS